MNDHPAGDRQTAGLHGQIPARGSTRLTVYRHFPDDEALFAACSAHWLGQQVLPAPDRWQEFDDAEQRLRFGLADLYRFYRDGQSMLRFVYRDRELLPAPQREELERQDALFSELLLAPFAVRGARRRLVSAAIAHAIAFGTWQSLCADQGLTNDEAVKALVTLVIALRYGTA